ncbi:hypothetical protein SALBM311S_00072 [Streptomyces alboniger]
MGLVQTRAALDTGVLARAGLVTGTGLFPGSDFLAACFLAGSGFLATDLLAGSGLLTGTGFLAAGLVTSTGFLAAGRVTGTRVTSRVARATGLVARTAGRVARTEGRADRLQGGGDRLEEGLAAGPCSRRCRRRSGRWRRPSWVNSEPPLSPGSAQTSVWMRPVTVRLRRSSPWRRVRGPGRRGARWCCPSGRLPGRRVGVRGLR